MRILFLSNYYPPYHRGGYEELCEEVALELVDRGHTVKVVTSNIRKGSEQSEKLDVQRILHPMVGSRAFIASLEYFYAHRRRVEQNRRLWENTCQMFDPGVILVWGMWNLPTVLLEDVEMKGHPPVVYYIADYWPTLPEAFQMHWQSPARKGLTQPFKTGLSRLALTRLSAEPVGRRLRFEHAVCVSQAVRAELIHIGLLNGEASVIYNGIAIEDFPPRPSLNRLPGEPLKLVYAGRLSPEKGLHTAVKAMSLVETPAQLTIIGGGDRDYENELRGLVDQYNLHDRVIFRGRMPRAQMANELAHHDVFLLPAEWPEPIPRAIQEALAIGLSVIAARIGGIPELIQDGINGFLFTPGDQQALSGKIAWLAAHPESLAGTGELGRATVNERFTLPRMVDELESYLAKLLSS
jgi:glycogen synthase